MEDVLNRAFDELVNEGIIKPDSRKYLASWTEEIQSRVQEIGEDIEEGSPGYKTISKYLSSKWKAIKKNL